MRTADWIAIAGGGLLVAVVLVARLGWDLGRPAAPEDLVVDALRLSEDAWPSDHRSEWPLVEPEGWVGCGVVLPTGDVEPGHWFVDRAGRLWALNGAADSAVRWGFDGDVRWAWGRDEPNDPSRDWVHDGDGGWWIQPTPWRLDDWIGLRLNRENPLLPPDLHGTGTSPPGIMAGCAWRWCDDQDPYCAGEWTR